MTTPDVRNLDPFDAPVPGEGMTAPKESRVWEKPAQFSKPKDAIDFVVGKIDSDESTKDEMLNLMTTGVPIESITNTITFTGFTEGKWTPDVAELIKLPIASYLIGLAVNNNIDATVFNKSPEERDESPVEDYNRMMAATRPEEFESMLNNTRMEEEELNTAMEDDNMREQQEMENQLPQDLGGFMPRREVV
tara:strand:- start:4724 stop:5299 length:576 start_codon:yes stop_codon:yes gene_type:complete